MKTCRLLERLRRDSAWIPWAFVGGFLIMFAANGAMIYASLRSWTGIEVDHYYQRGLRFNETIEDARRQAALGWRAGVRLGEDRIGAPLLEVVVRDAADRPVTGATVRAEMVRPTAEGNDFELALTETGEGRYAATVQAPLPGQWDARVNVRRGRDSFRVDQRVVFAR